MMETLFRATVGLWVLILVLILLSIGEALR